MASTSSRKLKEKSASFLELFFNDEVILGPMLGKGSFANVYAVQNFSPRAENDKNFDELKIQTRHSFGASSAQTNDGGESISSNTTSSTHRKKKEFAVKRLKDHFDDPKMYRYAARDLETEANLLSAIDHPNIIKVYAKSASGTKASKCTNPEQTKDFFIVEDKLTGTLQDKIQTWIKENKRSAVAPLFYRSRNSAVTKKKDLLMARLRIAKDVAGALAYLHQNGIVYRDLKPDNIGFDTEGTTKIFDFGLARKLPKDDPKKCTMKDKYVMSGKTGSLMLMAPEVWKEEPYNEKADVYSFAMLLWIMLALELPYLDLTHNMNVFTTKVMINGHRPAIKTVWPKEIQVLLKKAWSPNPDERPTMKEVYTTMKEAIVASSGRTPGGTTTTASTLKRPAIPSRSSFL